MTAKNGAARHVNPKQLVAILKAHDEAKTKVGSINGEIGERIKNAAENGHLDRKAYAVIVKADGMDEADRKRFLGNIALYADLLVEEGRWESHVGDLADMALEPAPGHDDVPEESEDDRAARENRAALEKGIRPLEGADVSGSYRVN